MSSSTMSSQFITQEGEAVRLLPKHGGVSSAGASLASLSHGPWEVVFTPPLALSTILAANGIRIQPRWASQIEHAMTYRRMRKDFPRFF